MYIYTHHRISIELGYIILLEAKQVLWCKPYRGGGAGGNFVVKGSNHGGRGLEMLAVLGTKN